MDCTPNAGKIVVVRGGEDGFGYARFADAAGRVGIVSNVNDGYFDVTFADGRGVGTARAFEVDAATPDQRKAFREERTAATETARSARVWRDACARVASASGRRGPRW